MYCIILAGNQIGEKKYVQEYNEAKLWTESNCSSPTISIQGQIKYFYIYLIIKWEMVAAFSYKTQYIFYVTRKSGVWHNAYKYKEYPCQACM